MTEFQVQTRPDGDSRSRSVGAAKSRHRAEPVKQASALSRFAAGLGVPGRRAVFKGRATAQCVRFQEALDEVQRAAIVPVQLVAPVARLFFEQRLDLTHADLPEIDDIHEWRESRATPVAQSHDNGTEGNPIAAVLGPRDLIHHHPYHRCGQRAVRGIKSHVVWKVDKSGP